MAVTNNATLIEDFEGAGPTFTSIGGGQGAALNTDIFIAGSASGGRRTDGVTGGFWWNPGAVTNLSAAGTWVKFYIWITHYTVTTAGNVRIGSATTAYETHTLTLSEYPPLGGWWPVWVEVGSGTDTGTPDFTNADEFGQEFTIGNVGGNAQNNIADQTHASTRPVMTWDGSTGTFSSFEATDASNALGTLVEFNGVYNLFANLKIGSATATTFTDSGVVVLAPSFSHLGSGTSWLGIDIDLQNASTVVTWTGSVYGASAPATAANRPDLLVTGTSGTADLSSNRFQGLRTVEFNSQVTAENCVFDTCGVINLTVAGSNGADISGSVITGSTVAADASALVWNVNADPDGELDDTTHTRGTNAHHAITFGANSPLTMTLRGWTTSGFSASNGQNDSTFLFADRGSDVTWTVNVIGGVGNFTFKKARAGDTVNIVVDPVTTLVNVLDNTGAALQSALVLVEASNGTGDLPFDDTVTITRSGTTASVSHTAHGMVVGDKVTIRYASDPLYNGVFAIFNVTTNAYDYTMSGTPSASPATPAAGFASIKATGVVVEGTTDVNGQVSASRTFSVDQPVRYRIRKSTGSPTFKSIPTSGFLNDTVDSVNGLTITQQMILDES